MANKKISQLDAQTTPASADFTVIVHDPLGSPATEKVTISNLSKAINLDNVSSGTTNKVYTATEQSKLSGIAESANNYTHPNHSGDVTSVADGATTIANNAVTTVKIADSNVTLAKLQNITTARLLGRITDEAGAVEQLTAANGRSVLGLGDSATKNVGSEAGTVCAGNDARLSDARTPSSHAHGNITNGGAIGETTGLPLKTGESGVIGVGAFGTSAGQFAEGNHNHTGVYESANANIQSHISSTSNPHSVTSTQVLPTQTDQSGKFLTTNGTVASWGTPAGGGSMSDLVDDTTPQLGGDLDTNQKNVLRINSLTSDNTAVGDVVTDIVAGENLVFGNIVYLKSDGKWWKAVNTAIATTGLIGFVMESKSADQAVKVMLRGFVRDDDYSFTVGGAVYLGGSGAVTQTAPSTEDYVIQVLGFAIHADRFYFNPSVDRIEYKA